MDKQQTEAAMKKYSYLSGIEEQFMRARLGGWQELQKFQSSKKFTSKQMSDLESHINKEIYKWDVADKYDFVHRHFEESNKEIDRRYEAAKKTVEAKYPDLRDDMIQKGREGLMKSLAIVVEIGEFKDSDAAVSFQKNHGIDDAMMNRMFQNLEKVTGRKIPAQKDIKAEQEAKAHKSEMARVKEHVSKYPYLTDRGTDPMGHFKTFLEARSRGVEGMREFQAKYHLNNQGMSNIEARLNNAILKEETAQEMRKQGANPRDIDAKVQEIDSKFRQAEAKISKTFPTLVDEIEQGRAGKYKAYAIAQEMEASGVKGAMSSFQKSHGLDDHWMNVTKEYATKRMAETRVDDISAKLSSIGATMTGASKPSHHESAGGKPGQGGEKSPQGKGAGKG